MLDRSSIRTWVPQPDRGRDIFYTSPCLYKYWAIDCSKSNRSNQNFRPKSSLLSNQERELAIWREIKQEPWWRPQETEAKLTRSLAQIEEHMITLVSYNAERFEIMDEAAALSHPSHDRGWFASRTVSRSAASTYAPVRECCTIHAAAGGTSSTHPPTPPLPWSKTWRAQPSNDEDLAPYMEAKQPNERVGKYAGVY